MSRKTEMETVLRRLTPCAAQDIDDISCRFDPRFQGTGKAVFPEGAIVPSGEPQFKDKDAVFVGLRVDAPLANPADTALEMATLALEHDAGVVVLTSLDYSGLERFGFRTERICADGTPESETCSEQVRRFWGLEMIL